MGEEVVPSVAQPYGAGQEAGRTASLATAAQYALVVQQSTTRREKA